MKADGFFPMRQRFLRVTQMLGIPTVLLALSSTALAQIEPGLPGSIEYTVLSNNQTWIQTSDPITTGTYFQDLLTDRLNQPDGRGSIGIVTDTGFDADYGVMAALVDFGRNYSVGIVFPELSPIQIVPEPSTLVLLPGVLFWSAALRRRRRCKETGRSMSSSRTVRPCALRRLRSIDVCDAPWPITRLPEVAPASLR